MLVFVFISAFDITNFFQVNYFVTTLSSYTNNFDIKQYNANIMTSEKKNIKGKAAVYPSLITCLWTSVHVTHDRKQQIVY